MLSHDLACSDGYPLRQMVGVCMWRHGVPSTQLEERALSMYGVKPDAHRYNVFGTVRLQPL